MHWVHLFRQTIFLNSEFDFFFFDDLHLQIITSISPKASIENSSAFKSSSFDCNKEIKYALCTFVSPNQLCNTGCSNLPIYNIYIERLFKNNVLDLYACLMQLKLALEIKYNICKSANKEKTFKGNVRFLPGHSVTTTCWIPKLLPKSFHEIYIY